jgi:hypothetical protein
VALITDYTSLQSTAVEYLARDGDATLTARVPTFIQFCEAKLNRMLFVSQMEQRSTTSVDTSSSEPEFVSLPSDFQSMRTLRLSGVTGKPRISFMTPTQLESYRYSIDNVSDQPVYFSIVGTEIELAPTPNEDYELEMIYRKNIPALSSNSTNWLLTLAPDLYLYGALLEASPYTKNDQRIQVWAAGFSNALDALNSLGDRQSFDSGPSTVWLPGVTP